MTKLAVILGVLIIAGTTVAQGFAANNERIAGFLPRGDAKPISRQEARLFGFAICKDAEGLFGDETLREWGACKYLEQGSDPLLLFGRGPALIPFSVFYGSFTKPGTQEVLVTMLYEGTDCCTESTVLFERAGQDWLPARLLEKTYAPSFLMFTTRSGRALLVRRRDVSGLGAPVAGTRGYSPGFELSVTDVGSSEATSSLLLDFSNPELNCLFRYASGARYSEIANWSRRDVNNDGFLDLVLDLGVTVLADVRCGDGGLTEDPRQPPLRRERLVFLFDGERIRPTLETERFKQYSQKPQGEAF